MQLFQIHGNGNPLRISQRKHHGGIRTTGHAVHSHITCAQINGCAPLHIPAHPATAAIVNFQNGIRSAVPEADLGSKKCIEGHLYSREGFICLHIAFPGCNRLKLFPKERAAHSAGTAILHGKGAVWNGLEFLRHNFGFFFFHGVPAPVRGCGARGTAKVCLTIL